MRTALLVATGIFAANLACEGPVERPPPITCRDCGTPNTGISSGVAPGGDPDGGVSGSGGAGSDEPVTLEGEVEILTDLADLASTRFVEPAALRVEGTNGDVIGEWDGVGPFSVEGVKRAGVVWAQATPESGGMLRGLRPVNTSDPNASVLRTAIGVARAADFQSVFDLLGLPVDFAETAGHAILVVKSGNAPVSGASVLAPRDAVVLYAQNGAFTDIATSTDGSGIVLVANVPAGAWPGTPMPLSLGGAGRGSYIVMLVSGGVTIGEVGN